MNTLPEFKATAVSSSWRATDNGGYLSASAAMDGFYPASFGRYDRALGGIGRDRKLMQADGDGGTAQGANVLERLAAKGFNVDRFFNGDSTNITHLPMTATQAPANIGNRAIGATLAGAPVPLESDRYVGTLLRHGVQAATGKPNLSLAAKGRVVCVAWAALHYNVAPTSAALADFADSLGKAIEQRDLMPSSSDKRSIFQLQQSLCAWGYDVEPTGTFDTATVQALTKFKSDHGLFASFATADGTPAVLPFLDNATKIEMFERQAHGTMRS